ncbi:MAG: alpha/beta hydrolase [Oscillospiraceae bacterium]|nr:alpha/beta hydrolase [Oscillospiraceae bacterium]
MVITWEITIPPLTGDEPRRAYVCLPEGWEEDDERRYPVLYMFDGHNVFFDEHATYGKSWGMADYMEQSETPMIVVGVECNHNPNNGRLSEYSPFTVVEPALGEGRIIGRGRTTMEWLVHTFKPMIDAQFPTIPDREHTFIGGSSMGGLMSLYAVTEYNRWFSRAACLSPSLWFATEQLDRLLRTAPLAEGTVIYMDYGSNEMKFHPNMKRQFARVTARLLERDVHLISRIVPNGDHCEACWERQIPWFIAALLYDLG